MNRDYFKYFCLNTERIDIKIFFLISQFYYLWVKEDTPFRDGEEIGVQVQDRDSQLDEIFY